MYSKENSQFVKELYREILNREYDQQGFQDHVEKLKKGTEKEVILSSFFKSKELIVKLNNSFRNPLYEKKNNNSTIFGRLHQIMKKKGKHFLDGVFLELLNRKPNKKEYYSFSYSAKGSNKDKRDIVIHIITSREFNSKIKINNRNLTLKSQNIAEKVTAEMVIKKLKTHFRRD